MNPVRRASLFRLGLGWGRQRPNTRAMDVERRLLVGIAIRTKTIGFEIIFQTSTHRALDGFDIDTVMTRSGGRAIRQQVIAPRKAFDAVADFVEAAANVGRVLGCKGTIATDGADLLVVDLGAHGDSVDLEVPVSYTH